MFRVMVVRMPKSIADTVTTYNNVYPFQLSQVGATGNALILPFDTDRVIKAYYDRVYSFPQVNVTQGGKEVHKSCASTSVARSQGRSRLTLLPRTHTFTVCVRIRTKSRSQCCGLKGEQPPRASVYGLDSGPTGLLPTKASSRRACQFMSTNLLARNPAHKLTNAAAARL
jgi:hypothetical protein